jgi:1,2-diacylglycerol 3-alpha-glucosyltransferase
MIVGSGPDEESLKKLAEKLGISDRVIFAGKAPYDDVPAYYHVASAFVPASITETQGLPTIEPMAASCPTLCINDDAFNKVISNELDGFLFNNQEEMIKYIEELIVDKKLRENISKQGRITADKYNSRNYAIGVLNVYRYALKEKKKKNKFFILRWIDKMKEDL